MSPRCKGLLVITDTYSEGITLMAYRCVNCGWYSKGRLLTTFIIDREPVALKPLWPIEPRKLQNGRSNH